jgi:hypothetical protein
MAAFCLATRMSPSEYRSLTKEEYMAYAKCLNGSAD